MSYCSERDSGRCAKCVNRICGRYTIKSIIQHAKTTTNNQLTKGKTSKGSIK